MSDIIRRREFLSNMWKWGVGLIGLAGAWTSWDLLQPIPTGGFGGVVKGVPADAVPVDDIVAVPAARGYLTKVGDEILALSWKCPHLGCRVPWCETSGEFECPCHGSVFDRAGDYREGPAPRGMDKYPVEVRTDGVVYIDTSTIEEGLPQGEKLIDEPPRGPMCTGGGEA